MFNHESMNSLRKAYSWRRRGAVGKCQLTDKEVAQSVKVLKTMRHTLNAIGNRYPDVMEDVRHMLIQLEEVTRQRQACPEKPNA